MRTHTHAGRTAGVKQVLVFTWVFTLMTRIAGLFEESAAATAIGILLCVVTVAVFVIALVLVITDRLHEKRAEQADSNTVAAVELTTKGPDNEIEEKEPGEAEEAGPSHGHESPADAAADEEKLEEPTASSSALSWSSILSIGSSNLCGAETADDTTTPVATGQDELASLVIAAGED